MAKKPAAKENSDLVDQLLSPLSAVDKAVQDAVKQINDYQKELKKAKTDAEIEELQKLVMKRQQMFFQLSNIVDKYNSTAKDIVRNIGR